MTSKVLSLPKSLFGFVNEGQCSKALRRAPLVPLQSLQRFRGLFTLATLDTPD